MCELCNFLQELCNTLIRSFKYFYIKGNLVPSKTMHIMISNATNATGYWDQKKEKLKQKFAVITNDDVRLIDGKEKEMMEMLCYKLEKSKIELVNIIVALQ